MKKLLATLLATMLGLSSISALSAHPSSGAVTASVLSASITRTPVIALTFDDGPSAYTSAILGVLDHFHAPATFFLVGSRIITRPADVRAEAHSGHLLGNHTFSHLDLALSSEPGIRSQIEAAQSATIAATGITPHWFRPPYGAVNQRVASVAASMGLYTALWSIDPRDWSLPGYAAIAQRILAQARPGAIIILHDGGGNRLQTVEALKVVVPALEIRGYRFVTLDDLFFPRKPGTGETLAGSGNSGSEHDGGTVVPPVQSHQT